MFKLKSSLKVYFKKTCKLILIFSAGLLITTSCDPDDRLFGVLQEGGEVIQDHEVRPDPEVISPLIVVEDLIECAESVTVRGFVPDAKIRIYANGSLIAEDTGIDPELQTFPVSPALIAGETITATQEFGGPEGPPSEGKTVLTLAEAYPSGVLPKPNFPFLYLYDCGIATHVNELPQGGQLRIFSRETPTGSATTLSSGSGVASGQSVNINPPFEKDKIITAESQICSMVSPPSDEQIVMEAPTTIPDPTADPIYDDATFVVVHGLVNGAKATISRAGTDIAVFGAPAGNVRVHGVNVSAGDVLEIRQEICGNSSGTTTVDVKDCSELQPPQLIGPMAGDTFGILTGVVAGSRVQIYAGTEEIADGGGSLIAYTRPLVDGEILFVKQSLGNCTSSSSYQVPVGTGLDDPGVVGNCGRIQDWEYGHNSDPDKVTTDVSSYFNSPDSGVSVPMNDVPLHGVVRYPEGPGPFPLVLIVHGNHSPSDPSYEGYNYLLELLASQCFITVSVEEDFLNGWVSGEMDARGIVLLRHLQLWREWSRTPGHPFFTKVDMSSIGLAGHSRGGEAIVAAALQNATLHNSADPPIGPTSHNFGFSIKSLYAIAPVDGQYDGGPITLTNADYYTMHGSLDGDVYTFGGQKTYNRAYPVTNSTSHIKGFTFIHGANHGQFNTGWGTCCESTYSGATLISDTDQQQFCKTYMSAYFKSELKGLTPYRNFLNGSVDFASIPSAVDKVFQFQNYDKLFLNHYEEDADPATGSITGITNADIGTFETYNVFSFDDRYGPHFLWGESQGLIAGWEQNNTSIRIELNDVDIPEYKYLAFHTGQTHEDPSDLNTPGVNKDFSVQLEFSSGPGPEVNVSSYGELIYPHVISEVKSIQQTIRIPFADLRQEGNEKPDEVRAIILIFDEQQTGKIAIDEIQFTN
ncbi:MAG: hypothetical protein HKO90_11760 [Flavobacteriaceae bacterium]|nr:hypothetical protein [Flavobacteriaceae bacterium]